MFRTLTIAGLLVAAVTVSGCDLNGYGSRLEFQGNDLYYTDAVTEAEAQKLGDFLVDQKFFDDSKRRSVQLTKEGETYQFRMVVVDDYKSMKGVYPNSFRALASTISRKVLDGKKLEFHLCNDKLETLEVLKPFDLSNPAEIVNAIKQSQSNK